MRCVNLCDITLCRSADGNTVPLTFRKKLDIASLLDRMQVQVIELGEIPATTEGKLLVKSLAAAVTCSHLAVSVGCDGKDADFLWEALKGARHPRLQVCVSLGTSRMEYVYHMKAGDLIPTVTAAIAKCRSLCDEVEFVADDATRADADFLKSVLQAAVGAGAGILTVCDTCGNMLPSEFGAFLTDVKATVIGDAPVALGVRCSNAIGLADATVVEAIRCGASEIKAAVGKANTASLSGIVNILHAKADYLGVEAQIGAESFAHNEKMIDRLCNLSGEAGTPFENGVREISSARVFTASDTEEDLYREMNSLGYDLSDRDRKNIYSAFLQIVSKKNQIDLHELEVIVASESMQVPQAYKLVSFAVTTGNTVDTVAQIKLEKDGALLDGVSLGNGSVDASFRAIETILGCHYELDDFQIQAITEGREAMGQTLVKLRSHGNLYSGKGISTDIVLSAVNAYLNALNKIVYEEERT